MYHGYFLEREAPDTGRRYGLIRRLSAPEYQIQRRIDPPSYERLKEGRNPKRIIRAIEFFYTTGKTITEQNEMSRLEESPYDAIKIGLGFLDREKLYERINLRVDLMLRNGLLEEARQVLGSELSQTSVKAIGYKELMLLDKAVQIIKGRLYG